MRRHTPWLRGDAFVTGDAWILHCYRLAVSHGGYLSVMKIKPDVDPVKGLLKEANMPDGNQSASLRNPMRPIIEMVLALRTMDDLPDAEIATRLNQEPTSKMLAPGGWWDARSVKVWGEVDPILRTTSRTFSFAASRRVDRG